MTDLKGKTLFITGATRGIGYAIAERAAKDGANIAIIAKIFKINIIFVSFEILFGFCILNAGGEISLTLIGVFPVFMFLIVLDILVTTSSIYKL